VRAEFGKRKAECGKQKAEFVKICFFVNLKDSTLSKSGDSSLYGGLFQQRIV